MSINIVLIEPQIPQNTGNIARTCAATASRLHLVKPLGFEVCDKHLKRAGLDYWKYTDISYHESFKDLQQQYPNGQYFFASTKSQKTYTQVKYTDNCFIVFGKETKGIDEEILYNNYDKCIRIPMIDEARSLNLSNSVAVILYEALRQNGFVTLKTSGKLTKY